MLTHLVQAIASVDDAVHIAVHANLLIDFQHTLILELRSDPEGVQTGHLIGLHTEIVTAFCLGYLILEPPVVLVDWQRHTIYTDGYHVAQLVGRRFPLLPTKEICNQL